MCCLYWPGIHQTKIILDRIAKIIATYFNTLDTKSESLWKFILFVVFKSEFIWNIFIDFISIKIYISLQKKVVKTLSSYNFCLFVMARFRQKTKSTLSIFLFAHFFKVFAHCSWNLSGVNRFFASFCIYDLKWSGIVVFDLTKLMSYANTFIHQSVWMMKGRYVTYNRIGFPRPSSEKTNRIFFQQNQWPKGQRESLTPTTQRPQRTVQQLWRMKIQRVRPEFPIFSFYILSISHLFTQVLWN